MKHILDKMLSIFKRKGKKKIPNRRRGIPEKH